MSNLSLESPANRLEKERDCLLLLLRQQEKLINEKDLALQDISRQIERLKAHVEALVKHHRSSRLRDPIRASGSEIERKRPN